MRNDFYVGCYEDPRFLAQSGVLNMKWGIRRYQNYDGSLTALGRQHYGVGEARVRKAKEAVNRKEISALKKNLKATKIQTKDLKKYGQVVRTNRINKLQSKAEKDRLDAESRKARVATEQEKATKFLNKLDPSVEVNVDKLSIQTMNTKGEAKIQKLLAKQEIANMKLEEAKYDANSNGDGALEEKQAHEAAKKAGLDQGDNWKVYRDAQRGDKRAQETVTQWELDKIEKYIKDSNWKETKNGRVEWVGNKNVSEGDKDAEYDHFMNLLDERDMLREKLPAKSNSDNSKDSKIESESVEYKQTDYSKDSGFTNDISHLAAYGGEIKPSDLKPEHRDSTAYKEYQKARKEYVKFEKSKDPGALDSPEALEAWQKLEDAGWWLSNIIEEDEKKHK